MNKRIKKIINIVLILVILINLIPTHIKAENTDVGIKGQLRCPLNNGGKCSEEKDAYGTVVKVVVTEQTDDSKITIKKIVEKTPNIDTFNVHFEIEGEAPPEKKADVFLVLDASHTVGKWYRDQPGHNIVDAVVQLSKDYLNEKKVKFGFASFYGEDNAFVSKIAFTDKELTRNDFGDNCRERTTTINTTNYVDGYTCKVVNNSRLYYNGSPIGVGLEKAQFLVKKGANRYIVVIGDGIYDNNQLTKAFKAIKNIKDKGIIVHSIRFGGATANECKNGKCNVKGISEFGNATTETPENIMKKMASSDNTFHNVQATKDISEELYNVVKTIIGTSPPVGATINDNLGAQFSEDDGRRVVEYSFSNLTNVSQSSDSLSIKIDSSSPTGWHQTNAGFSITTGETTKTFTVNPEVYWVQDKSWEGCSDYASDRFSKIINPNQYIELSCSQNEWVDGSGTIKPGYYAGLTLGSIGITTPPNHTFYVKKGGGFAGNIELESKLVCQISINTTAFITDYANLNQLIANATDERQRAEWMAHRNNMDNFILSDFSNIDIMNLPGEMLNFREKFINQGAELTVNYKNGNRSSEQATFVLSGDITDESACIGSNEVKININGIDYLVYGNKTCELHLKKKLTLPTRCLMMKTGEAVDCTMGSNEQIQGSNVFYVPLDEKEGGYISVTLSNATYSGRDISLNGNNQNDEGAYKCEYKIINRDKPIFRQIELKDPFLKTYNKDRKVGRNWNNTDNGLSFNFNFEKIIKDDIWSNKYLCRYTMSKVDVEKINKNTSELGPDSYLGNSCYINSDNKYVCDFIRPQTDSNGGNIYFSNIEEGKK